MKKYAILIAAAFISSPALANDGNGGAYAEIGVGAGYSSTDLKFNNPTGTRFTSNSTSGNYISLSGSDNSDSGMAAYAAAGYHLSPNFSVNSSYQYLGKFNASGGATFSGSNYEQVLATKAHGLYVGAAGTANLSSKIFAEVTGDVGVAFVKSDGTQGANLGGRGVFPSASHSNFSWGIGAGLGYRMSEKVSLVTRVKYFDAGKADTALSGPGANAIGMNVDERLETKLKATTATVGIRFAL